MSLTITLSPEMEARLQDEAAVQGRDIESVAAEALMELTFRRGQTVAELAASQRGQQTESLADALRGRIGKFHSGKGYLSEKTGQRFTEALTAEREDAAP